MKTVKGVKLATMNSGIKYKKRDDLLLVTFDKEANVAGVFTSSCMPAAPVTWCKKHIGNGNAKALIVNAGNANAFTGEKGQDIVAQTVQSISQEIPCQASQVFVSSTGVIGEAFDASLITTKIPQLIAHLDNSETAWEDAAKAIMTTDTKHKMASKTCDILGHSITISGFAKGSGMIAPNMATMLAYVFCDANISAEALSAMLKDINEDSFNAISVDSDQSTNDTVLLFATKASDHAAISDASDESLADFKACLKEVMTDLAKKIVIDGEGAKKLIEINVHGGQSKAQAKMVALTVGNSPLVKTAIAGCDPNWGRIVMAVGKSEVNTSPEKLTVHIGDYQLTKDGAQHPDYVESDVHEYLKNAEVSITIDLGIQPGDINNQATIWTCDLNDEYIKINKDYRS